MKKLHALRAQFAEVEKDCILLCPKTSSNPLSLAQSKLGGNGLVDNEAPECPMCQTTTAFVLQLFKSEFPSMFFPDGYDLFTVYRCRNENCEGVYDDSMDEFTVFQFHKLRNHLDALNPPNKSSDSSLPHCQFHPVIVKDYPNDEEEDYPEVNLQNEIEEEELDKLLDYFAPRNGTKIGGYPSFTQSPWHPDCLNCGKPTEFIFQLASGESIDANTENEYPHWSDHGITIGDLGNLYAYVCKACEPTNVITYWDCY